MEYINGPLEMRFLVLKETSISAFWGGNINKKTSPQSFYVGLIHAALLTRMVEGANLAQPCSLAEKELRLGPTLKKKKRLRTTAYQFSVWCHQLAFILAFCN